MNKAEELKLKFIRKWTSLLNEAEVVEDLDEYAQLYADAQSRERDREWMRHLSWWGDKAAKLCPVLPRKSNQKE